MPVLVLLFVALWFILRGTWFKVLPCIICYCSLGKERGNLRAFLTFVWFALVWFWFCLFPLPLGVWEGLRFVIVTYPGLFSYIFYSSIDFLFAFHLFHLCCFALTLIFCTSSSSCDKRQLCFLIVAFSWLLLINVITLRPVL